MKNTEDIKNIVQVETAIIGAGPAGLSVAACLRRTGVPFVVLERDDRVGAAWHRYFDNLYLHTHKAQSSLPYFPFPRHYPKYMSREQMIAYLESYARHFGLQPRFGQEVLSARLRNGHWHTRTQDTVYESRHLVVATGFNALPYTPAWPGQETFAGEIMHSSAYRGGARYRGKRVLIVGFGNSAGDMACDLWRQGAKPSIAVRSPVHIILPRDLLGLPLLTLAILLQKLPGRLAMALTATIVRLCYGDLAGLNSRKSRYVPFATNHSWPSIVQIALRKPPYGPFAQMQQQHPRVPMIDAGIIHLIRDGYVEVRPGIERFAGQDVVFTDGSLQPYDTVVLATGFRPAVDFLEPEYQTTDEHYDSRWSAREPGASRLHFCGFYIAATGTLREIAIEAKQIARNIAWKRPEPYPLKAQAHAFARVSASSGDLLRNT